MKRHLAYRMVAGAALVAAAVDQFEVSRSLAQAAGGGTNPSTIDAAHAASATAAENPGPSGNPLWTITLKQLEATRERPIFSPSRRPPPPPAIAAAYVPPPPPRAPQKSERPTISLVGTVASRNEEIGVFVEATTRNTVRLRVGDDHQGWVLRSVRAREATLEKNSEQAVLTLPQPGTEVTTVASATPLVDTPRRSPRR